MSAFSGSSVLDNMATQTKSKTTQSKGGTHVAVIGAGAFGGWTALLLRRRGARVTLLDSWGAGNSRASSGGETRIIRGTYGPQQPYTRMVARALELWRDNQKRWNRQLYHQTGVLWMVTQDDEQYERGSLPMLRDAGLPFEELTRAEIGKRYPQVSLEGVKWAIFEPQAGFLLARQGCQSVLEGFQAEGGQYRQLAVEAPSLGGGELKSIALSDGSKLVADHYVFACGPWLGKVFPDLVGDRIRPTRQEVFFFGTPPGDARFTDEKMPVWVDHGERFFYGIPGNERRGFKMADDTRGPLFDPTNEERIVSSEGLANARKHLALRFPELANAPVVETRVCQYENSPDQNFIMDRHPRAANVWLVGGGSGHGYKHGPAVGEMLAEMVMTGKAANPVFAIARFK